MGSRETAEDGPRVRREPMGRVRPEAVPCILDSRVRSVKAGFLLAEIAPRGRGQRRVMGNLGTGRGTSPSREQSPACSLSSKTCVQAFSRLSQPFPTPPKGVPLMKRSHRLATVALAWRLRRRGRRPRAHFHPPRSRRARTSGRRSTRPSARGCRRPPSTTSTRSLSRPSRTRPTRRRSRPSPRRFPSKA